MNRYHKQVYFPVSDKIKLESFTLKANNQSWSYSSHCLENVKYRVIDLNGLVTFIKGLKLNASDIFEYYKDNQSIIKAVYRINWLKNIDIILVIAENKRLVTIYLNSVEDKHFTLKTELYTRENSNV